MDQLFQASFEKIENIEISSLRTKCGKCRRFMKYIPLKPTRLYCPTCEETYSLPQNGTIKLYKELTCPLDGFELVLFSFGSNSKTYSVCPNCYNTPPLPDMTKGMGCDQCTCDTCPHSKINNAVFHCNICEIGTMILDAVSFPNWKLFCNLCTNLIFLPENAHKISVTKNICTNCGAKLLEVDFNKNKIPEVLGDKTLYTGCVCCDELLYGMTSAAKSRSRHPMYSNRGGRGRGGRGGNRGGRGKGKRGGKH